MVRSGAVAFFVLSMAALISALIATVRRPGVVADNHGHIFTTKTAKLVFLSIFAVIPILSVVALVSPRKWVKLVYGVEDPKKL